MPLPEAERQIWDSIVHSGEFAGLALDDIETGEYASPVSMFMNDDLDIITSVAELQDLIVGGLTSGVLDGEQEEIALAFIDAAIESYDQEAFLAEHILYEDTESGRIAMLKMPAIDGGIDE